MQPLSRLGRNILGFAAAAALTPLAVLCTAHYPAFRSIPWTLSYLVVAVITEIGDTAPVLFVCVLASAGIYRLVLAPQHGGFYNPIAWMQTATFYITALFISYVVRQRKLAVSSLQASEMHYRCVAESALDVIVTIDERSCILAINPSVRAVFGYEPAELIGREMVLLMPERLRAAHFAGIADHLETGARHIPWNGVQLPGQRKDGAEIPLEISFSSYTAAGRKRFTGIIRDISDRRQTQDALIQSEKLAAVGRLASSIAHEINNPLESITNLLYLARGNENMAEVQEFLDTAEQELRRVSVIANQTLQFHKQSTLPERVDCGGLLAGCLGLYQGKLVNANIGLELRSRAQLQAHCVQGEIRQVLNNLIGNAIDAMPSGGRLLARTRDATDWKTGKPNVVFTLADTGTGMTREIRRQIFNAFFSTKGPGGAGLGLWISSQLIARNGGTLRLRSRTLPGRSGTVFTLSLPC